MTNLNTNSNFILHQKTIGLVYDVPNSFVDSSLNLPHDCMAEWESKATIDIISQTWKDLGAEVILFPIDKNFFQKWAQDSKKCDVIHSLVEGYGSISREGWIPSLSELSGVPCIGSNPFVQSVCMNKTYVKMICKKLKIPTAKSYTIYEEDDLEKIKDSFFQKPHFIKPNGEGSGMGVDVKHSISSNKEQSIKTILNLIEKYPDGVLVETYLSGDEYTTGIIGKEKHFLPIAHIEVPDGVYGYANKSKDYLSEKVTFPKLSKQVQRNFKYYSETLFSFLNMYDMARFDWKCDEYGQVHFLEANTLPGLSKIYSPLPIMAQEVGIDYYELFIILFESAYSRKNHRSLAYGKFTRSAETLLLQ